MPDEKVNAMQSKRLGKLAAAPGMDQARAKELISTQARMPKSEDVEKVITKETNRQALMPSYKIGGKVTRTGPAMLHAGEKVIPADEAEEEVMEGIHHNDHTGYGPVLSAPIKAHLANMEDSSSTESARCLTCSWNGTRDKYEGDTAACPDCGSGTTRHGSPSVREDGRSAGEKKVAKTMHEWGQGELHSGSKKGPVVKSQKQAVAIALNTARRKGYKV